VEPSDSAKWDWLTGRGGGETTERRGKEQFWRGQADLVRYRGIFADMKAVRREEFSIPPWGEENCKGAEDQDQFRKRGLSSFVKPGGMAGSEPHTEEQFVTQANQSKVAAARRLEVSEVETL